MKLCTKFSFAHRVGNTMQGLISILDNLVMILTFSFFLPNWSMKFVMWRLDSPFYGHPKTKSLIVGDLVKPIDPTNVLHCATQRYPEAVVISMEPFKLTSTDSNMLWNMLNKEDYETIGKVSRKTLKHCKRRLKV